jgi:hypothetical protein
LISKGVTAEPSWIPKEMQPTGIGQEPDRLTDQNFQTWCVSTYKGHRLRSDTTSHVIRSIPTGNYFLAERFLQAAAFFAAGAFLLPSTFLSSCSAFLASARID